MAGDRDEGGAQGATQVVDACARAGMARRQQSCHGNDGGIARHRALDHIGKDAHHGLVEGE